MDKFLLAMVAFLFICNFSKAQDIHFSQYKESPLLLNPALTGNNNGDWRAGMNYREQWTNVAIPYSTINAYYDRKFFLYSKVIMGGGYVIVDQLNNDGLTRVTISPSVAYRIDYKGNILQAGLQPGVGFFNMGKNLTHPDQFNYETGKFDQSIYTDDIPGKYSKAYADIALGVHWSRTIGKFMPQAGISFYHLNRPKASLHVNDKKIRMPVKTLVDINLPVNIRSGIEISPSALIIRQRKSQQIVFGVDGAFNTSGFSGVVDNVFTGAHFRSAREGGLNSLIIIGGLEFNSVRFAFSYDEYFNTVKNTSTIGSTFELSITYTGINTFTDKFSVPCEIF